ncbi:hypothetical protein NCLIV_029390 [Neospora caninum Liverpool]|uniref:Uncharacterized protein n=1 Tax=Neospora caninum (strain Liverpool) TaxID=572307 RepID=F0VHF8_NEOCL|nr:hypothetical protein NCLIV_029390 [Neospora caninum Liverpool]CBZ53152.1 hypothetical protein NCLIV_029390 [Neospora caninum Liverpool]CEL67143.1 TPA: hypothetical protein BN1204_029390 [Neospora caninum Liverpool]|eukprot:XP_003883184.1 hypothetical protein NCLIV_029390 [Neospora caninum Liverpool]
MSSLSLGQGGCGEGNVQAEAVVARRDQKTRQEKDQSELENDKDEQGGATDGLAPAASSASLRAMCGEANRLPPLKRRSVSRRQSLREPGRAEHLSPLPLPRTDEETAKGVWALATLMLRMLLQVSLLLLLALGCFLHAVAAKCPALRRACTPWRGGATRTRSRVHALLSIFHLRNRRSEEELGQEKAEPRESKAAASLRRGEETCGATKTEPEPHLRADKLHAFVLFRSDELLLLAAAASPPVVARSPWRVSVPAGHVFLRSVAALFRACLETASDGPADSVLFPCLVSAFESKIRFLTIFDSAGVCCREQTLSRLFALLSSWRVSFLAAPPSTLPPGPASPHSTLHTCARPLSSSSLPSPCLSSPLPSSLPSSRHSSSLPSSRPPSSLPSSRAAERDAPTPAAVSAASSLDSRSCSARFSLSAWRWRSASSTGKGGRCGDSCMQEEANSLCCACPKEGRTRSRPRPLSPSRRHASLVPDNPLSLFLDSPQASSSLTSVPSTTASSASLSSSPLPLSSAPSMSSISSASSASSPLSPASSSSSSSFSSFPGRCSVCRPLPGPPLHAAAGHAPVSFRLLRKSSASRKRESLESKGAQKGREPSCGLPVSPEQDKGERDSGGESGPDESEEGQDMLVRIMCGCCAHEDLVRYFEATGVSSPAWPPCGEPSGQLLPQSVSVDGEARNEEQRKSSLPQDALSRSPSFSSVSFVSCASSRADNPDSLPSSSVSSKPSSRSAPFCPCVSSSPSLPSEQWRGENEDRGETRAASRRTGSTDSSSVVIRERRDGTPSVCIRARLVRSRLGAAALPAAEEKRETGRSISLPQSAARPIYGRNRWGEGEAETAETEAKKTAKGRGETGGVSLNEKVDKDAERDQWMQRMCGSSVSSAATGKSRSPARARDRVPSRTVIQQPELYRHLACGGPLFPPPLCVFLLGPSTQDLLRACLTAVSRRLVLGVCRLLGFAGDPDVREGGFCSLHEERKQASSGSRSPFKLQSLFNPGSCLLRTAVRAGERLRRLCRTGLLCRQFGRKAAERQGEREDGSAADKATGNAVLCACTLRQRRVADEGANVSSLASPRPTAPARRPGFTPPPQSPHRLFSPSKLVRPSPTDAAPPFSSLSLSVAQLGTLLMHALARRLVSLLAPFDYLPPFGLCGVPPFVLADAELCWPTRKGFGFCSRHSEQSEQGRAKTPKGDSEKHKLTETVSITGRKVAEDLRECLRDFQFRDLRFGR